MALALALILIGLIPAGAGARTTRLYQGSIGSLTGKLGPSKTASLAVDQSNGDIYVVSTSSGADKVSRFDASGAPKNFTAGPDAGTNTLAGFGGVVYGIAMDSSGGPLDGNIYVVVDQSPANGVRVFGRTGESRGLITGSGTSEVSFDHARAVAVDQSDGNLYVRPAIGGKIWRYSPNSPSGTITDADYAVTGISNVFSPGDPALAAGMGAVYIASSPGGSSPDGGTVGRFSASEFAASAPAVPADILEAESTFFHAIAVAVDPKTGELYAAERNRIAVFSSTGTLLYRFGASAYFGERTEGLAVKGAVSGSAEKVYVADSFFEARDVAVFGPVTHAVARTRLSLAAFGEDGSATSTFSSYLPSMAFRNVPAALFATAPDLPGIYGFDVSNAPPFTPLSAFSPLSTATAGFQPGVAVDNTTLSSAGNVYFTSQATGKMYGFASGGVPLAGFPVDPTVVPGPPAGSPAQLRGVGVDSEGHVWVVNTATKQVLEYSSAGAFLGAVDVSAKGEPAWLAFDSADNMYLTQATDGVWKYPAPSYDSPVLVDARPREQTAIVVDPSTDDLYVAYSKRFDIFSPSGELIEEVGTAKADAQTYRGIAVDPATKNVYLSDEISDQIRILGPALILPDLVLGPASNIGDTEVTLNGSVGAQTVPLEDCQFEYVSEDTFRLTGFEDLGSGGSVSCGSVPTDLEDHAVSAVASGLAPNTTYRFRITSINEEGSISTPDGSFSTPGPPLAETTGSPVRTTTTARLEGRISPSNSPASFHFEYGVEGPCDSSPCASTEAVAAGSGDTYKLAAARISGLQPGATYHYRIVADNGLAGSPAYGEDMTVTTRSSDAPLSHGHLPGPPGSDRAYEQVTLSDTGGNPVNAGVSFSDNGDRAVYFTSGGSPSSPVGGFRSQYFAERHETGLHTGSWRSSAVMPPREELIGANFSPPSGPSDLSSFAVPNFSLSSPIRNVWRLSPSASAQKLFEPIPPQEFRKWYVGSDDSTRVVAVLRGGTLDPAYPSAAALDNLYDISSGSPKLASILPDGTISPCGLPGEVSRFGLENEGGHTTRNWLSADGRLLFFQIGCGIPKLYVRDLEAEETKLVSGPPISGQDCGGILIKSTAGAAFFWTQSRLTGEDTDPASCSEAATGPDGDIYRYEIAGGALECLTCVVPGLDADVFEGSGNAESIMRGIAVAEDGSRVYFQSPNRLTPGAPNLPEGSSSGSLYRLETATGDLRWIAGPGASVGQEALSGASEGTGTAINRNGSEIVFGAKGPSLNQLGDGSDNGGTLQYYLYDDTDRSLVCVSCPSDGSAAKRSVPGSLLATFSSVGANVTPLADDGTFTFKSTEALLGADQNTAGAGQAPVSGTDLYEWRDGRVFLITDGLTNWPTGEIPTLNGVSPSGRDVFFTAPIQYTQDALDGYNRLYDARIGGGFEFPPPPKPCPLEVCQGTPKGAPEEQTPGTGTYLGPGNAVAQPAARKHKKQSAAKKKHKKKRPHKKTQQKQRAGHDGRNAR
jgi:hypothetical protein